jgi:hypothetical protein
VINLIYLESLCIEGLAKTRGGNVVVLLRSGLSPQREWQLLRELLTPEELARWMSQPKVLSA